MSKGVALLLVLVFLIASCIVVVKPVSAATADSSAGQTENTWATLSSMPAAGSYEAAVVNGKIYVMVGATNLEYYTATDTWATKKSMPTPRSSFALASRARKIA